MTNQVYQFAIKAVNVIGSSLLSDPITIRAAEAPAAPAAPEKKSSTLTTIKIQWTEPAYNGGNAVSSYKVYMDDGQAGSLAYLATITDLTTLEYEATSLTNSYEYNFAVSAINVIDEGSLSESTPILAATIPEAPDKPLKVSQTSTSIRISWNTPENNGSNIDDYKVLMCIGTAVDCTFIAVAASTAGSTSQLFTGLSKGN